MGPRLTFKKSDSEANCRDLSPETVVRNGKKLFRAKLSGEARVSVKMAH